MTTGSLLFHGCTFDSNTSATGGGAIWQRSGQPVFEYCYFTNNTGTGAVAYVTGYGTAPMLTMKSCVVRGNTSAGDAPVYIAGATNVFSNCVFDGNSGYSAGAIYYKSSIASSFSNCVFTSNTSTSSGASTAGAVYVDYGGASSKGFFINCYFAENVSAGTAGAVQANAACELINCTFFGNESRLNSTTQGGSALYSRGGSLSLKHCTVVGNYGYTQSILRYPFGTSSVSITNSIVTGNTNYTGSAYNISGTITAVDHSYIEAKNSSFSITTASSVWYAADVENILLDTTPADNGGIPVGDPEHGDVKIIKTVAILRGSSSLVGKAIALEGITTDARGKMRDAAPDLGAYEYVPLLSRTMVLVR